MAVSMTFTMRPKLPQALRSIGLSEEAIKRIDNQTLTQFTAWGIREIQKEFTSSGQGQPGGQPWQQLSAGWGTFKEALGFSPLIGVYKGALKQSVSGEVDRARSRSKIGVGGQASGYAERFDKNRPVLPDEDYAANRLQKLFFEKLGR